MNLATNQKRVAGVRQLFLPERLWILELNTSSEWNNRSKVTLTGYWKAKIPQTVKAKPFRVPAFELLSWLIEKVVITFIDKVNCGAYLQMHIRLLNARGTR